MQSQQSRELRLRQIQQRKLLDRQERIHSMDQTQPILGQLCGQEPEEQVAVCQGEQPEDCQGEQPFQLRQQCQGEQRAGTIG